MGIVQNDLDKRILAAFAAQNESYREILDNADTTTVNADELTELRRKAWMWDVIIGASRREIESMWDFMQASGASPDVLVVELGRLQRMRGVAA